MKLAYLLPLVAVALASCSEDKTEQQAARLLDDARFALKYHHYDAARDSIFSLRRCYPTAIEARRQAILLLDSVEMQAAADSLKKATGEEWKRLSVKTKFFERKLKEDKLKN